ncbi:hypothetical protein QZJ86_11905 [Methylomonas montana]|uniref:tetratricopeptide repeat protein n=1 Tax=Methylomonas montana TaxID=3058963 RepID=UPI002658DCE0|nr:hypothetical protein [Methylomonas montana]WKJ88726.1 hypothetical protein QZJ86_11905 [Methylomonas montana]
MLKIIFILFTLFFHDAFALYPESDLDFMALPPFCKAKLKPDSPHEVDLWARKLGNDFGHTHHFCAALHSLRLAKTIFPSNPELKERKRYLLSDATSDLKYMEEHAKPNFVLFPFIYTTKAEVLLEQGNKKDAITYLKKAISINKKYKMPYIILSDAYLSTDQKQLAKELLEEGVKNIPDSKMLSKRLQKLK